MFAVSSILKAYPFEGDSLVVEPFGSGLINHTWLVQHQQEHYILQQINTAVFKHPHIIENNIRLLAAYLKKNYPAYLFVEPVANKEGRQMTEDAEGSFFRLFPFVPHSHSKDVVSTPEQAYQAAAQFGRFTCVLSDFDVSQLQDAIPHFHDLSLRYQQFTLALKNGNPARISETKESIETLLSYSDIVKVYEAMHTHTGFKKRVTHHDTKISNVLFNEQDEALCVIDLDTTAQGYFISDVGDMMRTYLSPVSEEEKDFSKIEVRESFYQAIVQGYYSEMNTELSSVEKEHFFYAGTFLIYMQALRFLTDYLNDDIYYGAKYPTHNWMRAQNQIVLLKRLMEKRSLLNLK